MTLFDTSSSSHANFLFLSGSGEMGRLIRELEWSKTALGKVDTWPQSLRTTLNILLNSKFPMFLYWGPELVCFYNDAFVPSLGKEGKHPDALGMPGKDFWPEVWSSIQPVIEGVLSGGEAIWNEDQWLPINRNGKLDDVYWTYSVSPVFDESGKPAGVLVICSETTTQVKTLGKLQLSQQRFQNLIHQATVGIVVLSGEEMRVDIVNNNYGILIDRTHQELMGRPLFEVIPEAKPYFQPIIDKVRLTGEPLYLYDYPYFVTVNGTKKEGFLNLVYQPYKEEDEVITGVMVLCHDVTEQVLARKQIEASETRFRSLIAAAPAAIGLFVGRDLVIETPNQAFIDIVGKGWDIVGKPLREAMPELVTENQPFLQILDEVYTLGKMFQSFGSQVMIVQDGVMTNNYYNFTYTPLFDSEGKVFAILDIAVDVTGEIHARQQLEESERQAQALAEELAASNEELSAANEEILSTIDELSMSNTNLMRTNIDLDNFIYTASHDLKAPISNIEALLSALLRTLPLESLASDRTGHITSMMQESIERFKKTIANLTEVVKLQKENSVEAVLIDLSQVIGEVILDLDPLIKSTNANIEVSVSHCSQIHFSAKNLRSVVYNLLSNAIKYRSPDKVPLIMIGCENTSDYLVLTVSDNGLGMESGRMGQLFTMFKRFHDHVEGSGIGLYMVKKMVENAGGKIEVDSRLGEGSTFRIYFKC